MDALSPDTRLTSLAMLPRAVVARVTGFTGDPLRVERLRELGFIEDIEVELLHQSPFGGDPLAVRVGAMTVALRRSEAALVEVSL